MRFLEIFEIRNYGRQQISLSMQFFFILFHGTKKILTQKLQVVTVFNNSPCNLRMLLNQTLLSNQILKKALENSNWNILWKSLQLNYVPFPFQTHPCQLLNSVQYQKSATDKLLTEDSFLKRSLSEDEKRGKTKRRVQFSLQHKFIEN